MGNCLILDITIWIIWTEQKSFLTNIWSIDAIVDPPYGINAPNMSMGTNKSRNGDGYPGISTADRLRKGRLNNGGGKLKKRILNTASCYWDFQRPKPEYFKELFRVSKNQVIFGYNYFSDMLPPSRGIIASDYYTHLTLPTT